MTVLKVRDGIHLSPILRTDKASLLEYLNTRDIYNTTLTIPFPYREADADMWLRKRAQQDTRLTKVVSFAIRDSNGKLIGNIGADSFEAGTTYKTEIGYWLAKPFWGQGIMTDVVKAYVQYAFTELNLGKLMALTFEFNVGSARVLEKNGFKLEGCLRKDILKDGKPIDVRVYGLLKGDLDRMNRIYMKE